MKLTVINTSSDAVEINYVSIDGIERQVLVNPGKAYLPAGSRLISSNPNIRVINANNVSTQTPTQTIVSSPEVISKGSKK